MDRDEAVILGLLSRLKGRTVRTKFVKLVYLIDNLRAEHLGEPMTGLRYHWDHFGPDSVGHRIVKTLEKLCEDGLVQQSKRQIDDENYASYYRAAPKLDPRELPLLAHDWIFIDAVIKEHGGKRWNEVVRAAKATAPMQGATQYDILVLKKNEDIERRHEELDADEELARQRKEARNSTGRRISLDELKARYAESP